MERNRDDSSRPQNGCLGIFESNDTDPLSNSNVEWRGFGTDEDDQYLASLHFQARGDSMYPSSPYCTGPSHLDYTSFGPENTDF